MSESIRCVDDRGYTLYLTKDKAHLISESGTIKYTDWSPEDLHRVDGPAGVFGETKAWYLYGKRHRIDGPAIECVKIGSGWWLNATVYTYEEWKVEVRKYYNTQEDYLLMLLKL